VVSTFKRSIRRRTFWIPVAVVLYVGLWSLTQFVGTAQVQAMVAKEHLPGAGADCPRLLRCECDAVAVAPFLITAHYFWTTGNLAGGGAKVLYAWLGPARVQIWEWEMIAM
jgi:hypothetical protein